MEPVKLLLTLQKRIKDANVAIKQTQLDDIKWFLCILKLISSSLSLVQIWPTKIK
jgi:hypothetical protein